MYQIFRLHLCPQAIIQSQPFFVHIRYGKHISFFFSFYLSACERALYSGRNPRGTTRPSLPQSRYTPYEAEKKDWKKLWPIRVNALFLQPIGNKIKTKRERVTWLVRVSRAWHGIYVIASSSDWLNVLVAFVVIGYFMTGIRKPL